LQERWRFNDSEVCFFGVSTDPHDEQRTRAWDQIPGIRFFWDFDGAVSRAFGAYQEDQGEATYRPHSLLLDTRLRVVAVLEFNEAPETHMAQLLEVLRAQPLIEPATHAAVQAPVLVVPRVFEPELCRQLIELYERHGGYDSGFMREVDGKTVGLIDYTHKRRRDYDIDDDRVRRSCMVRIHDRLAPEIHKAFQFSATRMERYIVACYDSAESAHFRAHRDNTTKGTAHRRFAVSLHLNTGEYEGGYLRFPEFGNQLYIAPTGGAVVFSCSLLHEATPVTRGKRYMFLPFLYNDQAARIREQNAKYLVNDASNRAIGSL
jgi:predicted 2-oxoglutarate/Fe(II)-dependent dioxygenase YbiX